MAEFAPDRYEKMHVPPLRGQRPEAAADLPRLLAGAGRAGHGRRLPPCVYTAFDNGITHFDLANNYGPPPGNSERVVGEILKDMPRDELIISTKAGYGMWSGPYGDGGSKKYLVASLDQSLQRMGLDYVDIFYHHRPDDETPLEETLAALDLIVRQGKALYVGVSSYSGATLRAGRRDRAASTTGRRSPSTSPTTTCSGAASRRTCSRTRPCTGPESSPSARWPGAP